MTTLNETIAANVRRARLARGLSVQALAERARLRPAVIDRIERAEQKTVRVNDLEALAKVLGIEAIELMFAKGESRSRGR